jgi:clan AA aspartic protease (TIGR02281 family)
MNILKPLAIAGLFTIAATMAHAMELTCSAPVIYVGQQSRDAHDTVVGVDVLYSNGEWQVRHRMGNGSEIYRISQYSIRDTSNRSMTQWRGGSYKYPGILTMIGEIQRDQAGRPYYSEWIHNRGRLVMHMAAQCRERVTTAAPPALQPVPVQPPAAPPAPAAPPPAPVSAPAPQSQPMIIVVPQPPPQPPVVIQPEPKPEPKPVIVKRDSIPVNLQNDSVTLNLGVGNQTVTMLLDTGASSSTVTEAVAEALIRSGHARWAGVAQYSMADGSVRSVQTIVINEMRIGSHVVRNVKAGVNPNKAEMLLGFSVLKSIGPFMIDTRTNELVFITNEAAL